MESLATDNVVCQVEYGRQAYLLVGWHLVEVQAVQDSRLDLLGLLRRFRKVEKRRRRIVERCQELFALLVVE